MSPEPTESSGVQQLINRLHQDGVAKGQAEANDLLSEARRQELEILDGAKREANAILAAARDEADRTRAAGEEAIRLAGRDTILKLSEELRADFVRKLRSLIGHTLHDTDFLRQLLLEIAQHAVSSEGQTPPNILLLRESAVGDQSEENDRLNQLVESLVGEALRDGLTFQIEDHDSPGVRVQIVDDDLEIDLTTDTLTHLLLKHLSPRFRSVFDNS